MATKRTTAREGRKQPTKPTAKARPGAKPTKTAARPAKPKPKAEMPPAQAAAEELPDEGELEPGFDTDAGVDEEVE